MLCSGIGSAEIILVEDFEDNTLSFTTSHGLFHDGATDYFTIVPLNGPASHLAPYSGFGGANYFAAEDIDNGGVDIPPKPGTQTMSFNVNIANFNTLEFSTLFAAGGNAGTPPAYDDNDGFLVRASIDGGAFQNLLAFEAVGTTNQLLRQDADFDGTGDAAGFLPTSAFTVFSNLPIAGTGSNLLLEITVSSTDGDSEFAFDNVMITGTAVPEPSSLALLALVGCVVGFRRRRT
jgi:hypothetical protein